MFGYVRPLKSELKVREFEAYEAMYCGLCHAIASRYGFFGRFFLSYDFVFLAMLLSPGQGAPAQSGRRCPARPIRGKQACLCDVGLETAADESIILAWWKLRDDVRDSGFWKGLLPRTLSLLLGPAHKKAARLRPGFEAAVSACLSELDGLEREGCPEIDRTADCFARLLQAAAPETGDEAADRVSREILYHVGRWIYLADGVQDMEEDRAARRYNPVFARFPSDTAEDRAWLRTSMSHSLRLAGAALSLAGSGFWERILANILYLGLPAVEELVFTGKWDKRKAQGE